MIIFLRGSICKNYCKASILATLHLYGSTKIGRKKNRRTIIGRRQLLDTKIGRYEN